MCYEAGGVARIVGRVGNCDLPEQHEQMQALAGQKAECGDSGHRSKPDGQQRQHRRAAEQRLHDEVNGKQRCLPQVSAFALSEEKCRIARGEEPDEDRGPDEDSVQG